jgi:hypothetical protein
MRISTNFTFTPTNTSLLILSVFISAHALWVHTDQITVTKAQRLSVRVHLIVGAVLCVLCSC